MSYSPANRLLVFLTLCIFFNISLVAQEQDSIPKLVPTEVLLKKNNKSNYSISPSGKLFVEVIKTNIEYNIVVVDIDAYTMLHNIPLGPSEVDALYWLSDRRFIYESRGAIYAIDVDGSNQSQIVNRMADIPKKGRWVYFTDNINYNSVVNMLPNSEHQILIQTYESDMFATIKKVNLFTGQKLMVINGNKHKMNKWIVDANGEVRLGVRYDDDGYTYMIEDKSTNKWEPFYLNLPSGRFLLQIKAQSYLSQNLSFEGFGYDPNIIYITSNVDSDLRELLAYNIAEQRVEEVLAADTNADIMDPHGLPLHLIFDPQEQVLAGVCYQGLTQQFAWMSDRYRAIHTSLQTKYPRMVNDIIDVDARGERFVIYQWSDSNAGNIGIYDSKEDSYAVMFHFNDELNKYKLSKSRPYVATASDGYKIPCYVSLPVGATDLSQVPLVVIPHGGPWSRDYWGMDEFSSYFTSRGYATIRVNFRGSTGFGKDHVKQGISGLDQVMISDIVDATRDIAKKFKLEGDRFLFGHSYGGYATYMSMVQFKEDFIAGVAVSAPTDIKTWMKRQKKEGYSFSYEFWDMALGQKDNRYLTKISPLSYADVINRPLLIFHGKRDDVIPVDQAERMMERLESNGKDAKMEILETQGHSISDPNVLGYVLRQSEEFFKKNAAGQN